MRGWSQVSKKESVGCLSFSEVIKLSKLLLFPQLALPARKRGSLVNNSLFVEKYSVLRLTDLLVT